MRLFWTLFVFDAGIAAVLGVIFLVGLGDSIAAGHVDREDLLLWPPLIAAVAAVLGGGWWLKTQGRRRAANVTLSFMAVPGLLAGLGLLYLLTEMMRPGAWR